MLQAPSKSKEALQCLNAMVTDALEHLPYSLQYMEKVRNKQVLLCFASCTLQQQLNIVVRSVAQQPAALAAW